MQLRDYQIEAVEAVWGYFRKESGNPIIALPTGTGKSLVVAGICKRACYEFPTTRILMVTHVQELIEQNVEKLRALWPTAPVGIYSAGLDRRDVGFPITFGGIQSMAGKAKLFGHIDLMIVDEAHMVSHKDETSYIQFVDELLKINPRLKVIGLTATPYRLGLGMLTEGHMFDAVCYNGCDRDRFNRFIDQGYLARLVPKATASEIDVSAVKIQGGEFVANQLQKAVDKEAITEAAVREMIELGHDRNHWLIFAAGLEHAKHVTEMLEHFGVSATMVDGKLDKKVREQRLADFKSGKYRAMVNNSVLTTGFDFPQIDLIGMLRPTMSPGLWVQMLGRGTRPHPEKANCLVLDFARNTIRLGPINDPVIPSPRGKKGEKGAPPVKLCPNCGTYVHTSVRVCPECFAEFPENLQKWSMTAGTAELIAESMPQVVNFTVDTVVYSAHQKAGKPVSMKVTYHCGLRTFHEYVCFEHDGYARKKAGDWWRARNAAPMPPTTELGLLASKLLPLPRTIRVWENKKYPEILHHEF